MHIQELLLVIAVVIFGIGTWSRWWPSQQQPFWPAFLCAGLFFLSLSMLWPTIVR